MNFLISLFSLIDCILFNRAAGGKPVDVGPEETKAFQSEMDRIDTIYSAGPDFMKLPTFNFTGTRLFYVNLISGALQ